MFATGQAGLFYPLKTLNFIFTTVISSILLSAAHLFVAAIFTLAYLRELGLRLDVSLFGAVVFAFSRNIIGWLGFPVADAAIMLPGLFWITERLLRNARVRDLAIGAILIGVQFLAVSRRSHWFRHLRFRFMSFAGTCGRKVAGTENETFRSLSWNVGSWGSGRRNSDLAYDGVYEAECGVEVSLPIIQSHSLSPLRTHKLHRARFLWNAL